MAATNGQTLTQQPGDVMQEPSMEDILASIRRIIASDQHIAGSRPPAARQAPVTSGPAQASAARSTPDADAGAAELASVPSHPGEFPSLHDLESLVIQPAPIEPDMQSVEPGLEAPPHRREPAHVQLHAELFPPPEDVPSDEIYDLSPADRVASASDAEPLISSSARASVTSSFHRLAETMIMRDPEMIERLARDALRPMLKSWLDENLPSMVERLVRAEIERVARGGR